MARTSEWVRQTIAASAAQPMSTEAVFKSLERHVGQGDRALVRAREVLGYLDAQLIECNHGPAIRQLWAAVADYIEKVQEGLAAA